MKRWKSQDTAVDISFSRRFLSRWRGVIFHFPHWWSSKDWWQFIKHKLIMINADWSLIMYSLDNSLFFPRPGWPVSAIRTAQGGRKTSSGSWDSAIMTITIPFRALTRSTHVRCLHNTGDSVPKIEQKSKLFTDWAQNVEFLVPPKLVYGSMASECLQR